MWMLYLSYRWTTSAIDMPSNLVTDAFMHGYEFVKKMKYDACWEKVPIGEKLNFSAEQKI